MANFPPLDPAVFSIRLELCDGDDFSPMKAVVDQFFEDLVPLMNRLAAAEAAGDFGRVRDAAHSLKGSSATFGLMQVEGAARSLETAAVDSDLPVVSRSLATLRAVRPLGCEAMRKHVQELMAGAMRFPPPPASSCGP